MTRNAWLVRTIVALACALPLLAALASPASADREDRHGGGRGGQRGGYDNHGRNDNHWRGDRYRGGGYNHWDRYHDRRHGSSISGLFIWDLSPPPPRRVIVQQQPIIIQQPPIYMQPQQQQQQADYCREYTTTSLINGRPVETYGTACLQPDGSWRIVSQN